MGRCCSVTHVNFQTYRLNPASHLHWVCWEDEYVVFDESSGQTHQLDPVRAFVLHALSEGAQPVTELFDQLAQVPLLVASPHFPQLLSAVLDELQAHGLVEVIGS